jgi:hypothetical protein
MGPALWESGPGENPLQMAFRTNIMLTNDNIIASKMGFSSLAVNTCYWIMYHPKKDTSRRTTEPTCVRF